MYYKVKCIANNSYFTIEKVYLVHNGKITNDNNYTFSAWSKSGEDLNSLNKWFDKYGTKFELVQDDNIKDKIDDIRAERNEAVKTSILDSGTRRKFATGAVRDIQNGKGRCDLLPLAEVGTWLNSPVLKDIEEFRKTPNVDYLYLALTDFCYAQNLNAYDAVLELSKHFEDGARKYTENNWKKGIPQEAYIDSAVRHYLKFKRGDTDERHDRAFLWNILCLIWTFNNTKEVDDIKEAVND